MRRDIVQGVVYDQVSGNDADSAIANGRHLAPEALDGDERIPAALQDQVPGEGVSRQGTLDVVAGMPLEGRPERFQRGEGGQQLDDRGRVPRGVRIVAHQDPVAARVADLETYVARGYSLLTECLRQRIRQTLRMNGRQHGTGNAGACQKEEITHESHKSRLMLYYECGQSGF